MSKTSHDKTTSDGPANAADARDPRGQGRAEQCFVPEGEVVPIAKGSHVYLIDGSGYIFRAFHALPPLTRPSDGLPVGAVHGFCQMLWKLLGDSKLADKPTHIAVIFDHSAKTFRNDIYDQYKANRPPPPEELVPQFPLIRDAVKAFNVACIEQKGYEADDLIATYARQAVDAGGDVTIVSSDKDLMQLIQPGIVMFDGMKNKRIGPDEVFAKFGVVPGKVVDVQALAGDSTDNVPGVPGIGIKTAAELITTYEDLDTLLERAGEIKQPKRREKLIEFADQARISRDLVRLAQDVPMGTPIEEIGVQDPLPAPLIAFLRAMEFSTLTRRIAEALGADVSDLPEASVGASLKGATKPKRGTRAHDGAGEDKLAGKSGAGEAAAGTPAAGALAMAEAARAVPVDRSKYETVRDLEALKRWVVRCRNAGRFAFDTETTSLDAMQADLVGVSLATEPGLACYVPLGHVSGAEDLFGGGGLADNQIPLKEALALLKPLLEDASVLKIGQNLKYDALVLRQQGIGIAPFDDTMLLSYVLDGGRGGHGMDDLSERHLQHTCIPFSHVIQHAPGAKKADKTFAAVPIDKAAEYAAEDADITLRLWMVLKPRLVAEGMTTVYERLERPLLPVIVDMEHAGIKVDRQILSRLSGTFAQRIGALEEEVYELAGGERFNLGSPKQLGELLFDRLKLPGGKKTKTGQWETRAGLLDDLAANEELPEDARRLINTMLEWRQLSKLRSTYTDALPNHLDPETGRIHTSYALAATTTGRLASSDPNLQNIPVRTKEGREIRTAFIAEKGCKLVSADYSQIELRVLAHIADIPQLKKAFAEGLDIHAMTASEMFDKPVEGMPADVRRRAKAINFGIIYGISAFGLANQLGISREEAGDYIKTYFKRFPGIRDYMEETKRFARENGYVETVFGRRVHYPEINTRNPSMRGFLERAAINAPIQGSAADIIRRAMIRMPGALEEAKLASARMLLQVHDELIFEVREAEVDKTVKVARDVMEGASLPAIAFSVPIKVDAKAADNWEAAH
ncbi:MAG TPA: DNA polymerase I [Hyphomicrobiaceae bacterium]|nr:DNA polymerase I [Hyphomicrobiaceae bacterium]